MLYYDRFVITLTCLGCCIIISPSLSNGLRGARWRQFWCNCVLQKPPVEIVLLTTAPKARINRKATTTTRRMDGRTDYMTKIKLFFVSLLPSQLQLLLLMQSSLLFQFYEGKTENCEKRNVEGKFMATVGYWHSLKENEIKDDEE